MTCAERLLYLDPEDQPAADALLRLIAHVCAFNRTSATWAAAKVLERHKALKTRPLRDLSAALTALVDTPDDDVFSVVASVLWEDPRVQARISRLVHSRSPAKQAIALRIAWKVEFRGWPLLAKWASRPRDPVLVLTAFGANVHLLPEARHAEIAKAGLENAAAFIRRDAASLLASLDESVAARLARHALRDEPDPAIRAQLSGFLKKPARAHPLRRRSRITKRR